MAKAALIAAVPPLILKTAANPGGLPMAAFDKIRLGSVADCSQFYKDLASGPFFGANRPGAKVSQAMIDSFWLQGIPIRNRALLIVRDRLTNAVSAARGKCTKRRVPRASRG